MYRSRSHNLPGRSGMPTGGDPTISQVDPGDIPGSIPYSPRSIRDMYRSRFHDLPGRPGRYPRVDPLLSRIDPGDVPESIAQSPGSIRQMYRSRSRDPSSMGRATRIVRRDCHRSDGQSVAVTPLPVATLMGPDFWKFATLMGPANRQGLGATRRVA